MGIQRDGGDGAAMAFFGDGASSQGDVNEAFVWASVFNAPVVFFCQNNQWAISEPLERQTRIPLYQRRAGLRLPRRAGRRQRRPRRAGRDPGRAGAGARGQRPDADRGLHLPDGRAHHVRRPDPLPAGGRARDLEAQGPDRAGEGLPVAQRRRPTPTSSPRSTPTADELAAHLRAGCLALADPDPLTLFDHVYAEGSSLLDEEREQMSAYLASFEEARH